MSSEVMDVHLLDIEPELGAHLREDDRAEARERLRARVVDVPAGVWTLEGGDSRGRPFGFMLVEGMLLQEVQLAGRGALQLLGTGDLVIPYAHAVDSLSVGLAWTAAVPSRVAILDDQLQRPFALWPGLAIGLVERAGRQLSRLAIHAAIAQLPRVDQRLEALFWDLADRWGRVTPSGIHVPLALPHEILGRLVGGRRSTVTLALRDLAERGIVVRRPDRSWLLVSERPTLPTTAPEPASHPVLGTVSPPEQRHDVRPWDPVARRELLEAAARMRARQAQQERTLDENLRRYQEVQARSRELRGEFARYRRARELPPL